MGKSFPFSQKIKREKTYENEEQDIQLSELVLPLGISKWCFSIFWSHKATCCNVKTKIHSGIAELLLH